MSGDTITLTLPRERPFFGVANLVVGGLAVRLDLSYEELEDLQVALTELLEHHRGADGEVTLAVSVGDSEIRASLGPFGATLADELGREAGEDVGIRRVLDAVVDTVDVDERDGGHWVSLRKRVNRNGNAS